MIAAGHRVPRFQRRRGDTTYEVGVDAKNGKVLENQPEGKNPD
jgi:hypothetical protein